MSDFNPDSSRKSRVSVDSGGRILLPKKIRQRLGLAAGDELDVEFPVTGLDHAHEDAILLRAVRPEVPLCREGKFWVYRGGGAPAPVDVTGMIAAGFSDWRPVLYAYLLWSLVFSVGQVMARGERVLHECERLLARSPLKAEGREYRLYVTNAGWRHRLFFLPHPQAWGLAYAYPLGGNAFSSEADFNTGRVVHFGKHVKTGTAGPQTAEGLPPPTAPPPAGLWAYLATVLKIEDHPFGENPHPELVV